MPAYIPPQGYVQQPPVKSAKNGLNIASMVLGIVTLGMLFFCCGCTSPVTSILSLIFAIKGRENGKFDPKGLAGLICSVIFLGLFALFMAYYIILVVTTATAPMASTLLIPW